MTEAPLASTVIAFGLIPVAFLYLHAFLSGLRRWSYHRISGLLAIIWDLSMSIGYMIYRALGGEAGGSALKLSGPILIYFMIHGLVALVVMLLEVAVLTTGLWQWKRGNPIAWHRRLAMLLFFFLWWFAFLSGELFYVVVYIVR